MFEATPENLKKLSKGVTDVTYLSIDPGKTNGICGYTDKCDLVWVWTVAEKDILDFVKQFKNIETCVIENYLLYPNKTRQQIYSDMLTPRVIGRVESWAQLYDIKLIKQPAHVKSTGYKFLGLKPLPKTNPNNHFMDAHAHFIFWAVHKGKISASELLERAIPIDFNG